jgi:hypothetical protein
MGHPSSGDEEHAGYIGHPSPYDVLCGKGGEANNHEGNKRYLKLAEANKGNYRRARKGDKKQLSQKIVNWVNNGGHIYSTAKAAWEIPPNKQTNLVRPPHLGRFIKKSTINDLWYEIDNCSACRKVSQAFANEATSSSLQILKLMAEIHRTTRLKTQRTWRIAG